LANEIILYYDARSKKHQAIIWLHELNRAKFTSFGQYYFYNFFFQLPTYKFAVFIVS